jgi:hypothetical protein
MTLENVPADGWPAIPVLAPYETEQPTLETSLVDMSDEGAVDDFLQFHRDTLVPQLVCGPEDQSPWPQKGWVLSQDPPRSIVICLANGVMDGGWIIKDGGIYYPVANHQYIAATLRALWDETIKHFDYVWANSESPMVMAFAAKAIRVPATYSSPKINGDRLEWRRPV